MLSWCHWAAILSCYWASYLYLSFRSMGPTLWRGICSFYMHLLELPGLKGTHTLTTENISSFHFLFTHKWNILKAYIVSPVCRPGGIRTPAHFLIVEPPVYLKINNKNICLMNFISFFHWYFPTGTLFFIKEFWQLYKWKWGTFYFCSHFLQKSQIHLILSLCGYILYVILLDTQLGPFLGPYPPMVI